MVPLGDFVQLRLTRFEERTWSESDQLIGIRDRFIDVPSLVEHKKPASTDLTTPRSLSSQLLTWQINSPIRICGPGGTECPPAFIDLPNVFLRLKDELDCAQNTWEYYSNWRQRIVSKESGGTPDTMYVDMALQSEVEGEGLVDKLNLDEFDIVDLDPSVLARKMETTRGEIFELIHYVRKGSTLETTNVDMTDFYARGGVVNFRPAFAEFFMPPRTWYFLDDARAFEFIIAKLGLTRDEAMRNQLAISISHNGAVLERLTTAAPPFNIIKLIATMLNARE
jgi:hypothetical protein